MATVDDHDPLTPQERVDQALTQSRYGQAGIASLATGTWLDSGGGTNGQFVFANLDDLNAALHEWEALRDEIDQRNQWAWTIPPGATRRTPM